MESSIKGRRGDDTAMRGRGPGKREAAGELLLVRHRD